MPFYKKNSLPDYTVRGAKGAYKLNKPGITGLGIRGGAYLDDMLFGKRDPLKEIAKKLDPYGYFDRKKRKLQASDTEINYANSHGSNSTTSGATALCSAIPPVNERLTPTLGTKLSRTKRLRDNTPIDINKAIKKLFAQTMTLPSRGQFTLSAAEGLRANVGVVARHRAFSCFANPGGPEITNSNLTQGNSYWLRNDNQIPPITNNVNTGHGHWQNYFPIIYDCQNMNDLTNLATLTTDGGIGQLWNAYNSKEWTTTINTLRNTNPHVSDIAEQFAAITSNYSASGPMQFQPMHITKGHCKLNFINSGDYPAYVDIVVFRAKKQGVQEQYEVHTTDVLDKIFDSTPVGQILRENIQNYEEWRQYNNATIHNEANAEKDQIYLDAGGIDPLNNARSNGTGSGATATYPYIREPTLKFLAKYQTKGVNVASVESSYSEVCRRRVRIDVNGAYDETFHLGSAKYDYMEYGKESATDYLNNSNSLLQSDKRTTRLQSVPGETHVFMISACGVNVPAEKDTTTEMSLRSAAAQVLCTYYSENTVAPLQPIEKAATLHNRVIEIQPKHGFSNKLSVPPDHVIINKAQLNDPDA